MSSHCDLQSTFPAESQTAKTDKRTAAQERTMKFDQNTEFYLRQIDVFYRKTTHMYSETEVFEKYHQVSAKTMPQKKSARTNRSIGTLCETKNREDKQTTDFHSLSNLYLRKNVSFEPLFVSSRYLVHVDACDVCVFTMKGARKESGIQFEIAENTDTLTLSQQS